MNKAVALALFAGGILLIIFGVSAAGSFSSDISRFFSGAPTDKALMASVAITLLALAMFGYLKGHFTGAPSWRSAMQTVLIGGVDAGVAFVIARAIS